MFGEASTPFAPLPIGSSCPLFDSRLRIFRSIVDLVSNAVAKQIGQMCGSLASSPFATTNSSKSFASIQELINSGTQLEHLHSYQQPKTKSSRNGGLSSTCIQTWAFLFWQLLR
jgi:hypothetical protein